MYNDICKNTEIVMKIKSRRVFVCGCLMPAVIEMENHVIRSVLPYTAEADDDFGDALIIPGMIDVHCHGAYGFDTNYADPEGLRKWTAGIVREGVTGFLATTLTDQKETLLKALKNVNDVASSNYEGARILGVHLEGPFLDMKYKGAQPPEAIVPPSIDTFREYMEASGNRIRIITLAPEHDPDFALTRYCSSHGVRVSIGHSSATKEEAFLAVANGASSVTHTFNAMTPFTHRENGIAGTALRMHDLYSEIICDCNHSTPEALHIFFRSKSPQRCIMISDSLMCKGFEPGSKFLFGGHEVVIYPDGSAHLVKEGNLAGSTMRMNYGLRNLVEKAMVPLDTAVNSCTLNPAEMLGMDDRIGRISAGCDADLAVIGSDFEVITTYCKGIRQF